MFFCWAFIYLTFLINTGCLLHFLDLFLLWLGLRRLGFLFAFLAVMWRLRAWRGILIYGPIEPVKFLWHLGFFSIFAKAQVLTELLRGEGSKIGKLRNTSRRCPLIFGSVLVIFPSSSAKRIGSANKHIPYYSPPSGEVRDESAFLSPTILLLYLCVPS